MVETTMKRDQVAELTDELEQFKAEKEKIRMIVGQIGGVGFHRHEKMLTILFSILMVVLFVGDIARHFLGLDIPLPPLFSLEVGVLLVSIKIIFMINSQTRVEHFQFWILNSIEFRVDQISHRLRDIEKKLEKDED
jgi:hypothetical protein